VSAVHRKALVVARGAGELQIVEDGKAAGVGGFGQGARDTACPKAHGDCDIDAGDGAAGGIEDSDHGNLVAQEICALHIGLVGLLGDRHRAGTIAQHHDARAAIGAGLCVRRGAATSATATGVGRASHRGASQSACATAARTAAAGDAAGAFAATAAACHHAAGREPGTQAAAEVDARATVAAARGAQSAGDTGIPRRTGTTAATTALDIVGGTG
jgi:hypothetical protein